MKRVIDEQRLAFVATVCPDGTANLSPKGTIAVCDDSHLVFVDIRSPGTIRNLATNPSIEINVLDQFCRKGYRFKGAGVVVRDGGPFEELKKFYSNQRVDVGKGRSEIRIRAFVLVDIHEASPLVSPSYDSGAAEDEIRQEWIQYFASLNSKFAARNSVKNRDANSSLVRRYYDEMWNTWNFALADELLTEDICFRGSLGAEMKGRPAFCQYMLRVQSAFPDFHNEIEQLVTEGDQVVVRLKYTGTHRGEILGIQPSGKTIGYAGAAFFRVRDGRVAEGWVLGDLATLLGQLGAPAFQDRTG
jgi:steroid delta-isomerase-like uncharacterized protein